MTEFRHLVRHRHALVQQIATLAQAGYFFHTTGVVPEGKDPTAVDQKIIDAYATARTKYQTYHYRKKHGIASVKYLRLGNRFYLLATHGKHGFFDEEKDIRDIREAPLLTHGYAVAFYGGKLSVRIDRDTYRRMKEYFSAVAVGRSVSWLEEKLRAAPFEPWSGVQNQLFQLLAFVNQRRKRVKLLQLSHERAIRRKRRTYRVFIEPCGTPEGE